MELLAVVAILGMIAGAVVLDWRALLPRQRLNSAVRRLSDVLHGTRSEAISRNREFQIHYDLDKESYRVKTPYREDGGGFIESEEDMPRWVNETDLSELELEIVQVTVDDELYADGLVFVRFDPRGASSSHVVVLRQPMFDREFTIEVLPLTGDMRFHEGFFEREIAEETDFR